MKTRTLLAALALTIAPTITLAMGCSGGEHAQTSSCKAGTTWDAASASCVVNPLG